MKKSVIYVNYTKQGKFYFSRFDFWNMPLLKRDVSEARVFETKGQARQWIRDFLGGRKCYMVEEVNI